MRGVRLRESIVALAPTPWTLISGLLYSAAAPPFGTAHVTWFALVPWLIGLGRTPSAGRAALQGVWLSLCVTFGTLHWAVSAAQHEYAWPLYRAIAFLALLAPIACEPQFAVFAALKLIVTRRLSNGSSAASGTLAMLLFACSYCALEWALPRALNDTLGLAFYDRDHLRQIADLGGPRLITWLAVAVNLALADLAQRLASRPLTFEAVRVAAASSPVGAAGLLVVVAVVYGWIRNLQLRGDLSRPVDQIVLAGIQVNTVRPDGLAPARNPAEFNIQSMEAIYAMSEQALARSPRPELLVWPENAYRGRYRAPVMRLHGNMDRVLDGWVASRGVPLIFGGVEHTGERNYNAIFALAPEREPATGALALQTYRKGRLFPIGERTPGAATFPFLKRLLGVTDKDFDRPDEPAKLLVVALPGGRQVRIAPSVCFEAIYPNPILEASRVGAQVIVNLTNDGPFGRTAEPHQHLAASIFRSVETRLPMLRVAKTGISALVLPDGGVAAHTSIGTRENLLVSVPIVPSRWTLMRAWGDWFGPFTSFVAAAWVFGVFVRPLVPRRERAAATAS